MRKPVDMRSPIFPGDFPRTSFIEGLASILDLGGTLTREDTAKIAATQWAARLTQQGLLNPDAFQNGRLVAPPVGVKSAAETIAGYWQTVGQYMREAMGGEQEVAPPDSRPSAAEVE